MGEENDVAELLKITLSRLQQIFNSGYELEVMWKPDGNPKLSGEVKGSTIYVYERDKSGALQTLVHEFIDYLVSESIRPYRDVTNKLIELLNEYIYQRKERIVDAIAHGVLHLATNNGCSLTNRRKEKRR